MRLIFTLAFALLLLSPPTLGNGMVYLSGHGELRSVLTGATSGTTPSAAAGVSNIIAGPGGVSTHLVGKVCVAGNKLYVPLPQASALYSGTLNADGVSFTYTLAGGTAGSAGTTGLLLDLPVACVGDPATGDVYVADAGSNNIRKLPAGDGSAMELVAGSPSGAGGWKDDIVGGNALFCAPAALALGSGKLYVADYCSYTVRAVDLAAGANAAVSTVGGTGNAPGVSSTALWGPRDLVLSADGTKVYVADSTTVRALELTSNTLSIIAGVPTQAAPGQPNAYSALGSAAVGTMVRAVGITREAAGSDALIISHQCNNGVVLLRMDPSAASPLLELQSGSVASAECAANAPVVHYLDKDSFVLAGNTTAGVTTLFKLEDLIAPDETKPVVSSSTPGWAFVDQDASDKVNWYFQVGVPMLFPSGIDVARENLGSIVSADVEIQGTIDLGFFRFYTPPTGTSDYASWYQSSFAFLTSVLTPTGLVPGVLNTKTTLTVDSLASKVSPNGPLTSDSNSILSWSAASSAAIKLLSWQTSTTDTLNNWVMSRISFVYAATTNTLDLTSPAKAAGTAAAGAAADSQFQTSLGIQGIQSICGAIGTLGSSLPITSTCTTSGLSSVDSITISDAVVVGSDLTAQEVILSGSGSSLTLSTPALILIERLDASAGGNVVSNAAAVSVANLVLGPNSIFTVNIDQEVLSNIITVTGSATLDGTIALTSANNFVLASGLRILVLGLDGGSTITGQFSIVVVNPAQNVRKSSSSRSLLQSASTASVDCAVGTGCTATLGTAKGKDDGEDNLFVILALVAAGLVVLITIALAVVYYMKRSSSKNDEEKPRPRPRPGAYAAAGTDGDFDGVYPDQAGDSLASAANRAKSYGTANTGTTTATGTNETTSSSSSSSSSSSVGEGDFNTRSARYGTLAKNPSSSTTTTTTTTSGSGSKSTSQTQATSSTSSSSLSE